MQARGKKIFTANGIARGCSQWMKYRHILALGQLSVDRTILLDDQWERIEQRLPGKVSDRGVTAKDNRRFV
jgi:hypothetical protein